MPSALFVIQRYEGSSAKAVTEIEITFSQKESVLEKSSSNNKAAAKHQKTLSRLSAFCRLLKENEFKVGQLRQILLRSGQKSRIAFESSREQCKVQN